MIWRIKEKWTQHGEAFVERKQKHYRGRGVKYPPEHLNQTTPSHKLSLKPFRRSPKCFSTALLSDGLPQQVCATLFPNTLLQGSLIHCSFQLSSPFLCNTPSLFLVLNTKTPVSFLSSLLMLTSATTQKFGTLLGNASGLGNAWHVHMKFLSHWNWY